MSRDPLKFWVSLGVNRTVLALSIARMADGIGNSILFIILPLYVLKVPDELLPLPVPLLVGVLISAYGLAVAALQPLAATLADRFGHYKQIIQLGLLIIAAATFSFVFADRYLHLLGLRILQGAGLALEIPPTLALLAIFSRRQTRGGSMGFYTTLRITGLSLGPLIGGYLHVYFGIDAAFFGGTAILLLAALLVQFGVKPVAAPKSASCARYSPRFDLSLLSPGILSAAVATFLMASAFTLVTTLENEFNSRLGIDAFGFSLAFSALMVSRLVFQVPMGRLSDRFGRKPFILGGLLLLAPATALLGEVSTLVQFVVLRFVQGLGAAAIVAPALAFAGDVAQADGRGRQGQQMSVVTMGFGLGIAFGPLLAGILGIVFFQLPFWADGLLCLCGAGAVYRFMSEPTAQEDVPSERPGPDENG
jgi:MFS family permease